MKLQSAITEVVTENDPILLKAINQLDRELFARYADRFEIDPFINRALVSFQANRQRPVYRWYKFKEAFSAALVELLLQREGLKRGNLLDPFAGSGTALFAAAALGLDAEGIELLPIGQEIIATRDLLRKGLSEAEYEHLRLWLRERPWEATPLRRPLPEVRITQAAYPPATKDAIERYLGALETEPERVQQVLRFALLCILETISYTRKDGQYLRWDQRSGRRQGQKPFDKGDIPDFSSALSKKLEEILSDTSDLDLAGRLFAFPSTAQGDIRLHRGSALEILPHFHTGTFDVILTSPPYCNRYDYTRTYALELALLGVNENEFTRLRQAMLSSTVENRPKDLLTLNPAWVDVLYHVDHHPLTQNILEYLEAQLRAKALNNNGIPRMVRGYIYEMACVIAECARVLKPGAPLFMVNDNVRYAGVSISLDLILSDIATQVGFEVERIIVLPEKKGNSSQQMGTYGRETLRKCIYVWRKRV